MKNHEQVTTNYVESLSDSYVATLSDSWIDDNVDVLRNRLSRTNVSS